MKRNKTPKEILETKQQISRILDLPPSVISGGFHLEFSAYAEAVLTECEGIREYTEGSISLGTASMLVRFTGEGIRIRSMNAGTITLEGRFATVSFIDPNP